MSFAFIRYLWVPTVLFQAVAFAQIRYAAPMDSSASQLWSTNDSKLYCELIHDIPGYGATYFSTYSGRNLKTIMRVEPKITINSPSNMRFIATKPDWQSGSREQLLGRVPTYQGFAVYAGQTLSLKILTSLSHGLQILMPYTDESSVPGENIVPSLSPLGFENAYAKFLNCQQSLLRVSFADVQMIPIVFEFQSEAITPKSKRQLMQQISYMKEDPSINKISIKAFSYDMPTRAENIAMAANRADALKAFYEEQGFADELINLEPFNSMTLPADSEHPEISESFTSRNALVTLGRDLSKANLELDVDELDQGNVEP